MRKLCPRTFATCLLHNLWPWICRCGVCPMSWPWTSFASGVKQNILLSCHVAVVGPPRYLCASESAAWTAWCPTAMRCSLGACKYVYNTRRTWAKTKHTQQSWNREWWHNVQVYKTLSVYKHAGTRGSQTMSHDFRHYFQINKMTRLRKSAQTSWLLFLMPYVILSTRVLCLQTHTYSQLVESNIRWFIHLSNTETNNEMHRAPSNWTYKIACVSGSGQAKC